MNKVFGKCRLTKQNVLNATLCQKSCPALFKPNITDLVSKVYACWHKDKAKRQQAASGGLFTALMQNALKHNYFVCGCYFDK